MAIQNMAGAKRGAALIPAWLSALLVISCLPACKAETKAAEHPLAGRTSMYTPVTAPACASPRPEIAKTYATRHLGVEECPAPPPYLLFIVSDDARSWFDLRRDDRMWSTEQRVVYERDILALGHFPNVSGSAVVEWRLDEQGEPAALIIRLRLVDPAGDARKGATLSRLLVVGLAGAEPCDLGLAASNEDARLLADTASCAAPLPLIAPR